MVSCTAATPGISVAFGTSGTVGTRTIATCAVGLNSARNDDSKRVSSRGCPKQADLSGASRGTRRSLSAIESMAERLRLVPREAPDRSACFGHPRLETRFESSFRAEFRPTAQVAMVRVPTVPLVPKATLMPGVAAVQLTIYNAHGLDPRSTAQLPPY